MNMYTQLANGMQFTLHKVNRLKYYFIAESCENKQWVKHLVNILWFLIILTKFNWLYWRQVVVFLLLYLVLFWYIKRTLSIMFSINNRIAKDPSTLRKKNENHNKVVLLARYKFNNIENIIAETLIDNEISREDFTKCMIEENSIINKKKVLEWWRVKEVIKKDANW